MSEYRGPNPWGGVAEDPYSASEVVGQGDEGGPVQTVKIDHGGNNPDAVDPDETNAVRTDSEIEAGKDKQRGVDDLVVEDDAVERGAVTITNTSREEASEVEVVDNVSGTPDDSDDSGGSDNSTSQRMRNRNTSPDPSPDTTLTDATIDNSSPSLGGLSGAALAVVAVGAAVLLGGGD